MPVVTRDDILFELLLKSSTPAAEKFCSKESSFQEHENPDFDKYLAWKLINYLDAKQTEFFTSLPTPKVSSLYVVHSVIVQ